MAVFLFKSENIIKIEANPEDVLNRKTGQLSYTIDKYVSDVTTFATPGNVVLFGTMPSNCLISNIEMIQDEQDASGGDLLTVSCGLFYGFGGTQKFDGNEPGNVIDESVFVLNDFFLRHEDLAWQGRRFRNNGTVDPWREAWQLGGLSKDPGGYFYFGITTINAANVPVAGSLIAKIEYLV